MCDGDEFQASTSQGDICEVQTSHQPAGGAVDVLPQGPSPLARLAVLRPLPCRDLCLAPEVGDRRYELEKSRPGRTRVGSSSAGSSGKSQGGGTGVWSISSRRCSDSWGRSGRLQGLSRSCEQQAYILQCLSVEKAVVEQKEQSF